YRVFRDHVIVATARPVAEGWAASRSWAVVGVTLQEGVLQVTATGPPPDADGAALRRALDEAGLEDLPVRLSSVFGGAHDLPVQQPGEPGHLRGVTRGRPNGGHARVT